MDLLCCEPVVAIEKITAAAAATDSTDSTVIAVLFAIALILNGSLRLDFLFQLT